MEPLKRYAELERLATDYFETTRWKTRFCQRYGLSNQTATKWKTIGAPVWAVQAMRDALKLKQLAAATERLRDVLIDL